MLRPVHLDYTSELSQHFGYIPTWAPNYPLKLGDIVRIQDRSVIQVDSLRARGIAFDKRSGTKALFEYSSSDGVTLSEKVNVDAENIGDGLADAGLVVEFRRRHAIYFRAEEATIEAIEDKDALAADVLARHSSGTWRSEDAVVTEIVRARDVTVLIAASEQAKAELHGSLHGGVAGARFRSVLKKDLQTHIVSAGNLTPLFRAFGIARRMGNLFRASTENVVLRGQAPASSHDVTVGEIGFES
jgi:hypothetical protein